MKYGIALLFGLAGTVCIVLATSQGVGLSPDSKSYIGAARSLLSGNGFMVPGDGEYLPLTWYPPGFPTVLAILGLIGVDPIAGARLVNAFLFGANVVLVGTIVSRINLASYWTSILASCLVLTSTEMYEIHSMAWSEPTFIFLAFFTLATLASYLESDRPAYLVSAAISASFAVLTRYVGIVLIFVGLVSLLFLSRKAQRDRLIDGLLFSGIASFPIAIWLVRNHLLGFSVAGGRNFGIHPISYDHLESGLSSLSSWFLPPVFQNPTFGALLLCGIVILAVLVVKVSPQQKGFRSIAILALFLPAYLGFLIISASFLDPGVRLDNRLLAPTYVAVLLLFVLATALCGLPNVARNLVIVVLATTLILHMGRAPEWIARNRVSGLGYASTEWRNSKLIRYVKTLPCDAVIFSNGPDAIYLLADRVTRTIPSRPLTDFKIAEINSSLQQRNARLLYFTRLSWRYSYSDLEELKKRVPLHVDLNERDGQVLSTSQPQRPLQSSR